MATAPSSSPSQDVHPFGKCLYFTANADHQLVNKGKRSAEILWIATPPSF